MLLQCQKQKISGNSPDSFLSKIKISSRDSEAPQPRNARSAPNATISLSLEEQKQVFNLKSISSINYPMNGAGTAHTAKNFLNRHHSFIAESYSWPLDASFYLR